jgi:protein tyrosine phosphatase (PTP) superfamily phosphohydrolase (DUF442 family)
MTRRRSVAQLLAAWPLGCVLAQDTNTTPAHGLLAPNVVPIDARLVTSGQPRAAALAGLGALGFQAVICLAPPTVSDAVRDEPDLLRRQGIDYVNIPIPFDAPGQDHVEQFLAAMARFASRKVLVHCQVNLRASCMTFLHRVIAGREAPPTAYEAVARVWSPNGVWRILLVEQLRRHGSDFEPY